jgi:hypothetical protein
MKNGQINGHHLCSQVAVPRASSQGPTGGPLCNWGYGDEDTE